MIYVNNVKKVYNPGASEVAALKDINLCLPNRGMVFVVGKSGSGKSTLLNMLGGLDKPTSGEIVYGDVLLGGADGNADALRNAAVGFVFQDFGLTKSLKVGENVLAALRLQNKKPDKALLEDALFEVGLSGYGEKKISELSGGEQQRVAIARALIKSPQVIFADEPTGNLDAANGERVFEILKKFSKSRLVMVVSHDKASAERYGDRIIELADGCVVNDRVRKGILQMQAEKAGSAFEEIEVETIADADIDTMASDKENFGSEDFEPMLGYTPEYAGGATPGAVYEKSAPMRMKNVFYFAFKSIVARPLKTLSTILICAILFAMFGVSYVVSSYDKGTAHARTFFENTDSESVAVFTLSDYNMPDDLKSEDLVLPSDAIEHLEKTYASSFLPILRLNGFNISDKDLYAGLSMFELGGVFEMNSSKDVEKLGWSMKDFSSGNSRFPESGLPASNGISEVVLTDFLAMLIYREKWGFSYHSAETLKDFLNSNFEGRLLGEVIYFDAVNVRVKVVGIIDTGWKEKYLDEFLDGTDVPYIYSEMLFMARNFYCMLYSGKGFAASVYSTSLPANDVHFITAENTLFDYYVDKGHVTFRDGYMWSGALGEGEIILTENLFNKSFAEAFSPSKTYVFEGKLDLSDFTGAKVVGVIDNSSAINKFSSPFGAVVTDAGMKNAAAAQAFVYGAHVRLTEKTAPEFFTYLDSAELNIQSPFVYGAKFTGGALNVMKSIFLPLCIILAVVATAVLAMFMVNAVQKRKTELGTWKALGASSRDAALIYSISGIIQVLIIAGLSLAAAAGLAAMTNGILSSQMLRMADEYIMERITILYITVAPFLVTLAIIVGAGVLSSVLPAVKLSKMQPVEAMRKGD